MTKQKVLAVITKYESLFKKLAVPDKAFPHGKMPKNRTGKLSHYYSMLDEMKEFVSQNRMGKVFRWLGFIQGVSWSVNIYNLNSLKNHNRPDNRKKK